LVFDGSVFERTIVSVVEKACSRRCLAGFEVAIVFFFMEKVLLRGFRVWIA
jgi:hypothetical protein